MAKFSVDGIDSLMADFAALAKMSDEMTDEMLNVEADVIVEAQRKTMTGMLKGPYSTGDTARSIRKGKIKKNKNGKSISIAPQGRNRKGERHAAVAFINEYGKRGQPGRPAICTANAKAERAIAEAGEKVLNKYLDKRGL